MTNGVLFKSFLLIIVVAQNYRYPTNITYVSGVIKIANFGKSIELTCEMDYHPLTSVSWSKITNIRINGNWHRNIISHNLFTLNESGEIGMNRKYERFTLIYNRSKNEETLTYTLKVIFTIALFPVVSQSSYNI